MAEITDQQLTAILDCLAELSAQVVGIKNALKRDQIVTTDLIDQYTEKARQAVHVGWPGSLPHLAERLKRG